VLIHADALTQVTLRQRGAVRPEIARSSLERFQNLSVEPKRDRACSCHVIHRNTLNYTAYNHVPLGSRGEAGLRRDPHALDAGIAHVGPGAIEPSRASWRADYAAFVASDRAGAMTGAIANLTAGSLVD
jgi:hypothetical protein